MRASYFDPIKEKTIDRAVHPAEDFSALVEAILSLSSQRGHPTLELIRDDGSSLSLSTDGGRAHLVWTDSLGETFHSVGGNDGEPMVFDYFGSWSEASASCLVRLDDAIRCAGNYVLTGAVGTNEVLFEPD